MQDPGHKPLILEGPAMRNPTPPDTLGERSSKRAIWKTILLIAGAVVLTALLTVWVTTRFFFPRQFQPVTLDAGEKQALDAKIDRMDPTRFPKPYSPETSAVGPKGSSPSAEPLGPEPYSEAGARREITFTERELNALLATNTDWARKLAVDLSENMASAKLLVPLDPDMPFFGGKTLKASAGMELRFADGQPIVALKGISLWGIPIPNAWLGGIKNIDLVKEFGGRGGFWHAFAAGVEDIRIEEGKLTLRLRE
jgi:hypothetical protein